MSRTVRLGAALAALLPLCGCIIETDPVARPAPLVVQPAPSTGTVVVQPQP